MSSKRQRPPVPVQGKGDAKEEPQSKRIKKSEKDPTLINGKKNEVTLLGGLPLYGELLPRNNCLSIPESARNASLLLRQTMEKIKDLKTQNKDDSGDSRRKSLLIFEKLKKLNRLSHLYSKETRDITHDHRQEVDLLHLQLQNLRYEAMHLEKEITNCLEFRSQHEDIEMISEEEFYSTAPENISKPEVTRTDEHQRMLCRLEWELKQRKQLATQQSSLESSIKLKQAENGQQEEQLSSLRPTLEKLQQATQPVQEFFGIPLDWEKEQHDLALLLPSPLYLFYVQSEGYGKVQDKAVKIEIFGEKEEAKSFQTLLNREKSVDVESDSDQESTKEETSRKRKKKRRASGVITKDQLHSRAFPLTVNLTITTEASSEFGSVTVTFQYLPFFDATCATVTKLQPLGLNDSQMGFYTDKSSFLHCLFDRDSGRTSPSQVVSQHIRKCGGETFSSAVRQYGFPYRWVQRVCGSGTLAENSGATDVRCDSDLAATTITQVIKAIKQRMKAQVILAKELADLDQKKSDSSGRKSVGSPQSHIIRWKQINVSELQTSQFGGIAVFNLQERTNRLFVATLQHGQARMHAIICVTTDYPYTQPMVAILVELTSGQREPYDIQIKNIEAEINIHHPRTVRDKSRLLTSQMLRLRECFDLYVQMKTLPQSDMTGASQLHTRGKGRLISLGESQ